MIMTLTSIFLFACFLELGARSRAEALEKRNSSDLLWTCNQIAAAISDASEVFFPRECVILSFVILQSDGRSSYARVLARHFTRCCFEFSSIRLLGGARLGRRRQQDCKLS
jgi:hypothetical protein